MRLPLRPRAVSRRDAELLLDRAPVGDAHAGLAELLAAASAPAQPAELAGEEAALVAFRRAYAKRPATSAPTASVRRARRRVAVVALSVVVALVGGTAYAAGTSRLPAPVQQRLHAAMAGIGVPPPSSDAPSPSAAPGTPSDPAHLTLLCRAWQSTRTTPGAPELRPDDERSLAAAAGGPARIPDYCATLTATPSPATTPGGHGNPNPGGPPTTGPGTPPVPTPGNGNGHGAGNGNSNPGGPANPGNSRKPGPPG